MDTRETIVKCLRQTVVEQTGSPLETDVTDQTRLVDFRLDSLGFSVLLGRLEDELGYDPFAEMDGFAYPATLGELVSLYEGQRQG